MNNKNIIIVFIVFIFLLFLRKVKPMTTKQIVETYKSLAFKYGFIYNVEPSLILSVIKRESSGVPSAIGSSGEIGLGQLTRFSLQDFNTNFNTKVSLPDLFNPETNINVMTFYLSFLKKFFSDDFTILRAYNAGIGTIKTNETVSVDYAKSILETQLIVKEILRKDV